ncbi:uncharacterized protein LOC116067724 [Sander lucioperca]|uniref:uncharacterized protein LOC116067724 n=1 Tax=Sander lucioperca TaxID=283035 RepID=UPI00125DB5C4|nr:uncharacterized protein LOC116067724 [Sander lucioperca]
MDRTSDETENLEENYFNKKDVISMEDILVSFGGENSGEELAKIATEGEDETGRRETKNGCLKRLRSGWQAVLIGILMLLFCVVTSVLFAQINNQQSLIADLQHMAKNTKLQMENNQLKLLLNSTQLQYDQLKLLINATRYNFTLSVENKQLSLLLKNTLQEKTQLQMENQVLKRLLNSIYRNSTLLGNEYDNNFTLLSAENTQLSVLLKNTLQENTQLSLLLTNTLQEKTQLQVENQVLILNSTCQNSTLLGSEYDQLKLIINATPYNFTLLSAENTQLSLLLKDTLQGNTQLSLLLKNMLQEKTQLQVENKELNLVLKSTLEENGQLSLLLNKISQERTQLQVENEELKQLLNSTYQNFTLLGSEYDQLKLIINTTRYNFTLLSAEKTQLSLLLKNILQEKTQLQVENKELNLVLKSTLEENGQLKLRLSESLHIITLAYAESNQLRLLLNNEQKTSLQLQEKNKLQHSILYSNKLSNIWRFCKNDTLQCSRCMSGWTEHASRCFLLSKEIKKWEFGRRDCLDMGGDLAVVLNAEDQAFLTNMTFQYVRQNPTVDFHSAWIGLQDLVKEGDHIWINGERIQKNVNYWIPGEPNNAIASWDKEQSGQDCVAIIPPKAIGKDWLKSWDDIVCGGERNYICENMALILS